MRRASAFGKVCRFLPVILSTTLLAVSAARGDFPSPTLAETTVRVPLAAPLDDAVLAGGGRYIIARLPSETQLAVFDVSQAKVVGNIPTGEGRTLFAGGRDFVVVIKADDGVAQRYSLSPVKLEQTTKIELPQPLQTVAMGHASAGPLMLGFDRQFGNGSFLQAKISFMDPKTFKPLVYDLPREMTIYMDCFASSARASANGSVFTGWRKELSPSGLNSLVLTGKRGSFFTQHKSAGYLHPNDSGELIFTMNGIYSRDWKQKDGDQQKTFVAVPAVKGPMFVVVGERLDRRSSKDTSPVLSKVSIHSKSIANPLLELEDIELYGPKDEGLYRMPLMFDRRVFYYPQQELLVTLPESNDAIVLRKVKLTEELAKTGKAFLAVTSAPPLGGAVLDKPWEYAIQAISKEGKITYRLDDGPQGMTLSPEGVLRWTPKTKPVGGAASVVVTLEDAGGKSVLHTFDLPVERTGPPVPGTAGATTGGAASGPSLVKIEPQRSEITGGLCKAQIGNSGPNALLLVEYEKLLVLKPDGYSLLKVVSLPKSYEFIGRREKYLVGVTRAEPRTIEVIEEATGKVVQSQTLPSSKVFDLALHPTKPISYVSYRDSFDIPGCHFLVFDETTGKARQHEEFIGAMVAVDPAGRWLYTAYDDFYQNGSRLLMNPQRWHVVPDYGYLSLMLTYSLRDPMNPQGLSLNKESGNSERGLRVSPNGKQVVNVSPKGWGKLRGWNPADYKEVPLTYSLREQSESNDFAFHPTLPLGAAFADKRILTFDTKTADPVEDRAAMPDGGFPDGELQRLWFSADGRSLVVFQTIGGTPYLYVVPLKLSPAEIGKLPPASGIIVPPADAAPEKAANPVPLDAFDALRGGLGREMSAAEIAKWFSDSVVVVRCGSATGSGYVVGRGGYALTCAHCLEDGDTVEVEYRCVVNGQIVVKSAKGVIVQLDAARDLALLKFEPAAALRAIRLAPIDAAQNGDAVTVISNPGLGRDVLERTVTTGVISTAKRTIEGREYVQTSAAVNPGSSGGPMFNARGLVLGTVVLKGDIEGAGFAVPSAEVTRFLLRAVEPKSALQGFTRQWIDTTGKLAIDATLLELKDDALRIRRADTKQEFNLPLSRISTGDREFISQLRAAIAEPR